MGELGWLGVSLPESRRRRRAARFVDAALVLEQLGADARARAAPPLARRRRAHPRASAPTSSRRAGSRPSSPATRSLALAWAEAQSRYDVADVETRAERNGGGYRLTGEKRFVLNGHAADAIVVSARTSGGAARPRGRLALRRRPRARPASPSSP